MPNHCDSDLKVVGPEEDIETFMSRYVTAYNGTVLNLDAILPYPERFKELDRIAEEYQAAVKALPREENGITIPRDVQERFVAEHGPRPTDGFNSGGYEWCTDNWGTKWGCYPGGYSGDEESGIVEREPGQVTLHFQTAWGPFNTDLLQTVSMDLPRLHFEYDSYEAGMGFQCHVVVEHGDVLVDDSDSYSGDRGG